MCADTITADAPPARPAAGRPPALTIWTRLKFMIARGFLVAWARCFSLKGLYLFGQVFGTLEWLINYKRRRRYWERFHQVFGEHAGRIDPDARRKACRNHFTRTRCDKLFYLIFDKLPRHKIMKRIKFHDRQLVDEAVARNKGVYICLSHTGSHHVLILLAALLGYRCAGVRDPKEGAIRRYVQERYEATFPEFREIRLFFSDTYPRDIYRCFQDNCLVGTALDVGRDRGGHLRTATVEMFGKPREFLTGTMQIALRCGAPILQGFVLSRKNFYFHLVPKGPLVDPDHQADEPAIVQQAMQRYADNIADLLAEYPDHISKV